jgi:demethylmenaquinone methyltransferase/2-methoxy-6-polyprenyl-1,4-benzoquinol methylase
MLNTNFSKETNSKTDLSLSEENIQKIQESNKNFDTGTEKRLSPIFTEEIWKKIKNLGLTEKSFIEKNVLDLCAGTGFLSYHICQRTKTKKITLIDISETEINEAKKTLPEKFPEQTFDFKISDITTTDFPDNTFDIIIGNSFIHHLWDINKTLQEIKRILRPGGIFISLHEPTPISLAHESGSLITACLFLKKGNSFYDSCRTKEDNPGTDVWVFNKSDMETILKNNNFNNIKIKNWHIFRSLIYFWLKIYEIQDKNDLNFFKKTAFRIAIAIDAFLQKIIPDRFFASIAIICYK